MGAPIRLHVTWCNNRFFDEDFYCNVREKKEGHTPQRPETGAAVVGDLVAGVGALVGAGVGALVCARIPPLAVMDATAIKATIAANRVKK
jgi:hypothetical protein